MSVMRKCMKCGEAKDRDKDFKNDPWVCNACVGAGQAPVAEPPKPAATPEPATVQAESPAVVEPVAKMEVEGATQGPIVEPPKPVVTPDPVAVVVECVTNVEAEAPNPVEPPTASQPVEAAGEVPAEAQAAATPPRDSKLNAHAAPFVPSLIKQKKEAEHAKDLGNEALDSGNPLQAIAYFTEAINCDPTNPVYYKNRSNANLKAGRLMEALEDVSSANSLNPHELSVLGDQAEAHLKDRQGKGKKKKPDDEQSIALIAACKEGKVAEVATLLKAGIPLERTDKDGATALLVAAQEGKEEIVGMLLEARANPNHEACGSSPLMTAVKANYKKCVQRLLQARADLSYYNAEGETILVLAAAKGHVGIMKELLQAKANPDFEMSTGTTPLMMAALNNQVDCVRELLKANADASREKRNGETAFDFALRGGSQAVMDLLEKQGRKRGNGRRL